MTCLPGHIEKVHSERNHPAEWLRADQIALRGRRFDRRSILRRAGQRSLRQCSSGSKMRPPCNAAAGGDGALREIAEILLQAQGHWDGLLKKYEVE